MELYTNGIHRGTLHIKKQLQNKDKTLFFTKMLRPGEQAAPANKKIKKKDKDTRHRLLYIQDRVGISVHTCSRRKQRPHKGFTISAGSTLLEASLSDMVQYIKQINTYTYTVHT